MVMPADADAVVIGSGFAGCSAACGWRRAASASVPG
jgi:succinate dehydrogenase/fumarate reductase flavoprotein subunit